MISWVCKSCFSKLLIYEIHIHKHNQFIIKTKNQINILIHNVSLNNWHWPIFSEDIHTYTYTNIHIYIHLHIHLHIHIYQLPTALRREWTSIIAVLAFQFGGVLHLLAHLVFYRGVRSVHRIKQNFIFSLV